MNIKFIKSIDKYLGIPLVSFFSCLRRLRIKRKKEEKKEKTILFVKFWGMGNIILSLPVFCAVRKYFPSSRLLFLTLERNRGLVEACHFSDEVLYLKLGSFFKLILDSIKLIFDLKYRKINLVFDFEEFARFSTLLSYLSGADKRIGFSTECIYRGNLYTKSVLFKEDIHALENFIALVRLAGVRVLDKDYIKISYFREDIAYIDLLLDGSFAPPRRLIGLNAGGGPNTLLRRWPAHNFIELADRLTEELGAGLLFVGTDSERGIVSSVIKKLKGAALNLTGLTNKTQLACLIEKCSIFISNDSGLAHFVQAMKVPTVVLFGPESPAKYGPRDSMHKAIYRDLPCSPCLSVNNMKSTRCKDPICIEKITVEEVFNEAKRLYEKHAVAC